MDGGRAGSGSGSASGSNTGACPFLRRQSNKRTFSTMAETRRSSSPDSLFVSPDPHYNNDAHPAQRQPPLALPPMSRRSRYAGDGFDYRRPAATTSTASGMGSDVIDLTLEDDSRSARTAPEASLTAATPEPGPSRTTTQQRLPNFQSRNIIDVESDVEEHEEEEREASRGGAFRYHTRRPGHREDHRQVQGEGHHFTAPHHPPRDIDMAARNSTAPPSRRLPRPWDAEPAPRSITPHPTGPAANGNTTIDLTADDDDDVVFTEIRPRVMPQLNTGRPEATAGIGTRGVVDGMFDIGARTTAAVLEHFFGPANAAAGQRHGIHLPIPGARDARGLNINLEYTLAAFQVGAEPNRPPTPQYEAPPKADPGFTRSPGENEEVVCPNCGDELCMGESDIKQQVWVIKGCGHAYCGECAHNRGPKKAKGKGKAKMDASSSSHALPPMRKCQVLGCGTSAANKAMLRVYVDG